MKIYAKSDFVRRKLREQELSKLFIENAGLDLYIDLDNYPNSVKVRDQGELDPPFVFLENGLIKIVPKAGLTRYPFIAFFHTGIHLELPKGVHAIVHGRSGRFFKDSIDVFRGVIDSSYRGEIVVGLIFYRVDSVILNPENAIAQLVFIDNRSLLGRKVEFVDTLDELSSTDRGQKGFGSTDKM
jgi:deoxyuridine 5'-triphosphate nucleotidohydrolase